MNGRDLLEGGYDTQRKARTGVGRLRDKGSPASSEERMNAGQGCRTFTRALHARRKLKFSL